MNKFALTVALTAIALTGLAAPHAAFAHGGQIEVGGGARGPVKLTPPQQTAIDLKTDKAAPHPLASLLKITGEIQLPPDRQADVNPRLSGQVQELDANIGDEVHAGQKLAVIQGRVVGNATVAITAPMSGVIDARDVATGQAVEPGTRLFHISDRSRMNAVGRVYEESLGQVRVGQEESIHLLAYPQQMFTGKVSLIEPNLDPASRTVKVWVALDNPQGVLKPNMFARIGLVLKSDEGALSVSNDAIIEANGEKVVFVRDGDTFTRTEIETGAADDKYTEVTNGLIPGDEVATQGNREIYTMWLTGGQMKSGDGD
jgi:multidrug efflux pump subunit AcrA (membrane-fusion protein)